ncbi:ankyrin repeat domain-containing protein [Lacinutrix sp. 5H-3-7-4]|uniref:ankyrin repeat domain-containing protein n=1 Tax=Lacinutrix sp. (strain 5H-3-7-4) TaxID=983544 RepID=UPI00020A3504|nr:ankyrin repeat domain-containing protein [Lacinutrix sp. 5H-3-7-4]AEH00725.1 Ankyrin [Lacinutrix sp. 5H-3-7-4]
MKNLITVAILFISIQITAQDNALLNRKFWSPTVSIEDVENAIAKGNNPSQLNNNSFDPMVYAILQSAPNDVLKFMLSQEGNDVNKLTHDGRTYIFWAAYAGNDTIMKYLISKGAKTDVLDDHGFTALNFAANAGQANTEVYNICLENGADLKNDVNHDGANALLLAAPSNFELVEYFQDKGLDIKSTDKNGNGIFNYVAKKANIEILKSLDEKGLKGNDQAFIFASQGTRGNTNGIDVYQYLENIGLNPDVKTNEGLTPLHNVASRSKDLKVIHYFIENGNNINAADKNGSTPFLNAVKSNSIEVIESLLSQVENIEQANKKGETALMLAVQNNSAEVVELLLSKEASIKAKDAKGNNLSYYLIESYSPRNENDFENKLQLLQNNGLEFTKPQDNGNTLIHLALDKNNAKFLKQIAQFEIDVNAVNKDGYTALHLAAMKATDVKLLKHLLAIGANKEAKTTFEETAFDLASENEILSKKDISINFLK